MKVKTTSQATIKDFVQSAYEELGPYKEEIEYMILDSDNYEVCVKCSKCRIYLHAPIERQIAFITAVVRNEHSYDDDDE